MAYRRRSFSRFRRSFRGRPMRRRSYGRYRSRRVRRLRIGFRR